MALVYCRGCQKQIEHTYPKCPHCGASMMASAESDALRSRAGRTQVNIFLALIICAGLFVGIYAASSTDRRENAPKPPKLNASVRTGGDVILITNKDAFDYEDAIVEVNGGDYYLKHQRIARGETKMLNLREFASASGRRFDPSAWKVQSAYLECQRGRCAWELR